MKLKKLLFSPRILILLILIVMAIVAIKPFPKSGVEIRGVIKNSPAELAGIKKPEANLAPTSREVIKEINNIKIKNLEDYYDIVRTLKENDTVFIKTNKNLYKLIVKNVNVSDLDNILGLYVGEASSSNIRKGLDLQGGTRVLLKPEEAIDDNTLSLVVDVLKERLNVFGLADVTVRTASDLSGNKYVVVEIAGVSEQEVKDIVASQGKFEAKINNVTVFRGGKDITYVDRSRYAGIDPQQGCNKINDQWMCKFFFAIKLSPEAAKRQAELTKDLEVISIGNEQYLSANLSLYLDNELVDELRIGADLKGRAVTDISISGPGFGRTKEEAMRDALANMKKLQTILITGSLPVKLEIVKTDYISALFGKEFLRNAIFIGFLALLAVFIVVYLRYRSFKVALPVIFTMLSEIILLLGFAALVAWNIDLAAIAGLIVAAGTGVDDQIVIADEILRGEKAAYDWRKKLKRAFFIIIGSYLTTVVAMIPLLFAGAGLVKGFALITITGVTIGVFITRPAFAKIVEILLK